MTLTLTVTDSDDSGAGTLRDTVTAANSGDTINFSASVQADTITLTSPIDLDTPRSWRDAGTIPVGGA